MTEMLNKEFSRKTFLKGGGALVVGLSLGSAGLASVADAAGPFPMVDPAQLDTWLSIDSKGMVTVRSGRVDQGQGKQTAYAQIVAEELDVRFDAVKVILGDTGVTPDQGNSTSTDGIRSGARPLRNAAAQARDALIGLAAANLGVAKASLTVSDGVVSGGGRTVTYGELIGNRRFNITMTVTGTERPTDLRGLNVTPTVPVKDPSAYRVVGQSIPRVDIPAKVAGSYPYTQNIVVPGMLHARMVLPPHVGAYPRMVPQLLSARFRSKAPAGAQLFVRGNFVAVVADEEWNAIQAAKLVDAKWAMDEKMPNLGNYYAALRQQKNNEFTPTDTVTTRGDVDAAFAAPGAKTLTARYDFPQQIHGLIGPSVAVASFNKDSGSLLIWAGSQNLVRTRADTAEMLGLSLESVRVLYTEQSSLFGRGGVDDVGPAAALLSKELGRPVRVQWMRQDEQAWGPQQPGRTHDLRGAVDGSGHIVAWQEESWGIRARWDEGWPLPWLLLGTARPVDALSNAATGAPAYVVPNLRSVSHTVDPLTRPMYMRTVGGTQTRFIHESFVDELAAAASEDPIEFRVKHLDLTNPVNQRALAVLREVQRRSGWQGRPSPAPGATSGTIVRGRGFSLSPSASCCIANVAEVEVNRKTGVVSVSKLWAVAELGTIVNPDGVHNQFQGGSIMGISRALKETARLSKNSVTSVDWVTYPILRFKDVPPLDLTVLPTPASIPAGGIGEPSSIAVPAAIGNAFFDATGVRMRSLPLTPGRVRAALKGAGVK
jgi:CO/xanthine dehydrogenase Mo-binding subunit